MAEDASMPAAATGAPPPPPPPPPGVIVAAPAMNPPGVNVALPFISAAPTTKPSDEVDMEEEHAEGESDEGGSEGSEREDVNVDTMEYEVSEESRKAQERKEQLVQKLLLQRRANALAIPTKDSAVRQRLRSLQHPVTLFGEREMERRDRLRSIIAKLDADGELETLMQTQDAAGEAAAAAGLEDGNADTVQEDVPPLQLFYTEGTEELLVCRRDILKYSLPRAQERVERAKRKQNDPDEDEDVETQQVLDAMASTSMECSEIGDSRPLSACAFSPDASLLVTGSWTGVAKVWSVPDVKQVGTFKGHHAERVTDVVFHPGACKIQDAASGNIATASADRTAILWSLDGQKLQSYEGHLDRLARVAFHPSGAYIGTASFDKTWRLWDVNTGIELLLQEGHSRSVYGIAFQQDGALAASCGMDALARVWDLRTGKSILALEGHVKPVYGVDFSPNGYHLATGSDDHTCRVWDLRKKQSLYIIPAHASLISQVKYEPSEGYFLVTASFDNTARIWSARDFKPVRTLAGHESKLAGVDVAADGSYIGTVSHDRTIKLWACPKVEANV